MRRTETIAFAPGYARSLRANLPLKKKSPIFIKNEKCWEIFREVFHFQLHENPFISSRLLLAQTGRQKDGRNKLF
jgi:hypothetical protein